MTRRMMIVMIGAWTAATTGIITIRAGESVVGIHAEDDGLARTPPMGWYPWNQFGQGPQNEPLIKEIADSIVSTGMRDAGYVYAGPDEGICFYRDNSGALTTNLERYPGGLRGLGDYLHAKGLKYALYTDAGAHTCSKAMPGTRDFESEDMRRFADWRCDYVKIDWCYTEGLEVVKTYTLLHDGQHAAGRPIVHSLCSWGEGEPWKWAAAVGHLWRTTGDICNPGRADWDKAIKIALTNEKLFEWAGPGHWNDPDIMIVGMAGLSEAQNRSLFSLWCMMAAPLIAGNDVRTMSDSTQKILTNLEAIGVNQDPLGQQGHVIRNNDKVSIWAGKRLYDGSRAVLVFNPQSAAADVRVAWADIGFDNTAGLYVRDIWEHRTTGPVVDGITVTVAPNDAAMLRISGTNDFPLPPIISADSYLISLRASGATAQTLTGAITIRNQGSGELPFWQIRKNLPKWLTATAVKDGRNQILTNTITTRGLKKGFYHAVVRADNTEPVSGKPMSAFYYDVDLEIPNDVADAAEAVAEPKQ
jgi:alpha-galactosidase